MSRSGYCDWDWSDSGENWRMIRWRGAVKKAMRGKRGQALLAEMRDALDALPTKELGTRDLIDDNGCVCALGAVAWWRGIDLSGDLDPEDSWQVSEAFGIADAMAREIVYENDEAGGWREAPAHRWARMRRWVDSNLHIPRVGETFAKLEGTE